MKQKELVFKGLVECPVPGCKRGFYTSVFTTKPKPIGTIEDGLTIQFGSNNSETELVVYDKLLEQRRRNKISDKDYWVRYEMRFRGDKAERVIYQLCRDCLNEEDELYGLNSKKFADSKKVPIFAL